MALQEEMDLIAFCHVRMSMTSVFVSKHSEVYLDGIPLKGEWRGGTRRPNRRGEEVKAGTSKPGSRKPSCTEWIRMVEWQNCRVMAE